jgi:predicted phosphate transport protein (TIGR00153 family)
MNINSILSIFAPKDVKFIPLLREIAEISDKAAELLQELFTSTTPEQVSELCKAIKSEESNGDKVIAKVFRALNDTFITPFDREDITALTDAMDDVIDTINRVAQKVILFSPEKLPPATVEMTIVIKKGATEIKLAVNELTNLKKSDNKQIRTHTREIKLLEEEADKIYERGTSSLFKSDMRTLELIKLKEIIQELEKTANRINGVGKILKTMIVKYA